MRIMLHLIWVFAVYQSTHQVREKTPSGIFQSIAYTVDPGLYVHQRLDSMLELCLTFQIVRRRVMNMRFQGHVHYSSICSKTIVYILTLVMLNIFKCISEFIMLSSSIPAVGT